MKAGRPLGVYHQDGKEWTIYRDDYRCCYVAVCGNLRQDVPDEAVMQWTRGSALVREWEQRCLRDRLIRTRNKRWERKVDYLETKYWARVRKNAGRGALAVGWLWAAMLVILFTIKLFQELIRVVLG